MDSDPQMERKAHLNKLLVYAVIGLSSLLSISFSF